MMTEYLSLSTKAKNLIGQRFGRLVALGPIAKDRYNKLIWHCQCDCGNQVSVLSNSLHSGNTQSCGCLQVERTARHGLSQSSIYSKWQGIVRRCHDPKSPNFERYGGRGIEVCPEWRDSFEAFYADVSVLPDFGEDGYSLDRINNDLGYEPGNVRWATRKEQQRNRRGNHELEIDGVTRTIGEWAEISGRRDSTIHGRLKRGWSPNDAVFASSVGAKRVRHPENYPADWAEIATFIKAANGYVCQECGRKCQKPGEPYRGGKNVLTVAHVDNDYHSAEIFVAALCSGCHLRHDGAQRRRLGRMAEGEYQRLQPRFHGFFDVRK